MKEKEKNCIYCNELITYTDETKPEFCPKCGEKYWDKPKEEAKLFKIQDKYFDNGKDPKYLNEMYEILIFYSENIIKKKLKGKKQFSYDVLHEKAEDLALAFMTSTYFKNPDYRSRDSFGGMLSQISLGILYAKKVKFQDSILSLDYQLDDNLKLSDNPLYFMESSPDKEKYEMDAYKEYDKSHPEDLVEVVMSIVRNTFEEVEYHEGKYFAMLYLCAIQDFLLKNKKCTIDDFYNYYGDVVKPYVDDTLTLIKKELTSK